jgi:hypothetical protein
MAKMEKRNKMRRGPGRILQRQHALPALFISGGQISITNSMNQGPARDLGSSRSDVLSKLLDRAVYLSLRVNGYREHLERVHLSRQCLRCAQVFSGKLKDRVADLAAHQRAPNDERCQLNTKSEALKEGIDPVQWDKIVRLIRSGSNSQGGHSAKAKTNLDKWMEIWDVLFSDEARPETPCKSNDGRLKQRANFHRVRRT